MDIDIAAIVGLSPLTPRNGHVNKILLNMNPAKLCQVPARTIGFGRRLPHLACASSKMIDRWDIHRPPDPNLFLEKNTFVFSDHRRPGSAFCQLIRKDENGHSPDNRAVSTYQITKSKRRKPELG